MSRTNRDPVDYVAWEDYPVGRDGVLKNGVNGHKKTLSNKCYGGESCWNPDAKRKFKQHRSGQDRHEADLEMLDMIDEMCDELSSDLCDTEYDE